MTGHSQPQAPDSREYRQTIGLFATGVTVLTAYTSQDEIATMTANAVTSISLDPMLVLVAVGKKASIAPHILTAEHFALNILTADQQPLSDYFARLWKEEEPPAHRFEDWDGVPHLQETLGAIACRRYDVIDGGDHWMVLGEITGLRRDENTTDPLIFFGGQYRELSQQET